MTVLYLKLNLSKEVTSRRIALKDVASFYCAEKKIEEQIGNLTLIQLKETEEFRVISVLKIMELIEKRYPDLMIMNVGEQEVLVQMASEKKESRFFTMGKLLFVMLISFFGTGFTIMAFHNDIGIRKVFQRVYEIITGTPAKGYSILEIAYSFGLCIGILIFFNHIGRKKITADPTPIEVEMRIYEDSVNKAKIENTDREGNTIDVS